MNSLSFFSASGSPSAALEIQDLSIPGNTSGASYLGFFGTGGPEGSPFAVIVNNYQDATFITNSTGQNLGASPYGVVGSGRCFNHKFVDSSTTNLTDDDATYGNVALSNVPVQSGTLLMVFEASGVTPVITQNAVLRTVNLNASSGVDSIEGIVTGIDVRAFEVGGDISWTQTAGAGAAANSLALTDHGTSSLRHDFYVGLSASPLAVGERADFGFFCVIEFL